METRGKGRAGRGWWVRGQRQGRWGMVAILTYQWCLGLLRNATIHQTRKTWKISSMGRREIQWRFLNLGLLTMAYNCQDGKDYANDGLRTIGVCKEERGIPACKKKAQTAFLLWSIPVRTRGRIQRTASLIWAPNLENAHFYQRQAVKAWGGRLTPFFSWEWSWSPHR